MVEDYYDARWAVRELLVSDGFHVDEARNGKEALDFLLSRETPALIVLTRETPVMSGTELLERMKSYERLAGVPVILLSAYERPPKDEQIVAFFTKPCDFEALSQAVRRHARLPN